MVSLTVTEKGYCQDVNGDLDTSNAFIKDDLEGDLAKPKSAIGMIVAALRQRKRKGMVSFTVLSCDNLPENGDKVRLSEYRFSKDRQCCLMCVSERGRVRVRAGDDDQARVFGSLTADQARGATDGGVSGP